MIFRRRFDTTRAELFATWTDAARLALWFGPSSATGTVGQLDAQTGGTWRVEFRPTDNGPYALKGVYAEVVANERLVFTMDVSEHPDAWHALLDSMRDTPTGARAGGIVTTVEFADAEDKTVVTVSQRFDEPGDRDAHYHMGSPKEWGERFDRLERLLAR